MKSLFLKIPAVVCLAASLIPATAQMGPGQDGQGQDGPDKHPGTPASKPYMPQPPDHQLEQLLTQIDQNNLQATVQKLVSFGTRHTSSSQTDPNRGIGAATAWVFQQLQTYAAASGNMTVFKQSFVQPAGPKIPVPTTITNVIATLQGSASPERFYVIVAHLDDRATDVLDFTSDAPGADRDASGVAVVLELARVMSLAKQVLPGTIVFSVVAGEEEGLFGSTFMAQQMAAAGNDVQGAFSVDTIGNSTAQDGTKDPKEVRLFTEGIPSSATANQISILQAVGGEDDSSSRELGRFVKSVAENPSTGMSIWLMRRRDGYLKASDNIAFSQQGFPAARFTEPNENFNHEAQNVQVVNGVQLGDLASFLDYAFMARVARVSGAALWSLAEGPATPKGLELHVSPPVNFAGTNQTTLTWFAAPDPDLAGYEVVWRNMDDTDWTHVIPVGTVTSITFSFFPEDNFIVGLRTVDTSGRHSPVAYPAVVTF